MRLTNLFKCESEETAQDFQKRVAERKKTHIFVKVSLPFNTDKNHWALHSQVVDPANDPGRLF